MLGVAEEPTTDQVRSWGDWKMDPVLEIWVETDEGTATVRLRGTLDGRTGHNVAGVVGELVDDGHRLVTLDITGTTVQAGGEDVLEAIDRRAGALGAVVVRTLDPSSPLTVNDA
jgi:hypothetical protein